MHESVLLTESINSLKLKKNSLIIDCTLGYAGHSQEILKQIPNGHLYAFDQDDEAIKYSEKILKTIGNNYTIINSNFKNIEEKMSELNITEVDGILYDLGVSSPQLDTKERGFSYHQDSRLDMRMDKNSDLSAYEVVNQYSLEQLIKIFKQYGEEKYAVSIAKAIIKNRPVETTIQLVELIKDNVPFSYKKDKHPARKVFQSIRIEVNDELNVLEQSLNKALNLIKVNGRISVITFHSLEDRIVKQLFKKISSVEDTLLKLPVIPEEYQPKFKIIGSFNPNQEEIKHNNRSRSAKLRVIERIR